MRCSPGKFIHWRTRESRRNPRTWGRMHQPIVRLALLLRRHVHFAGDLIGFAGLVVQRGCVPLKHRFPNFATKIYHCDVNSNDASCLEFFKDLEHCTDGPQGVALNFLTAGRPAPVSSPRARDCASPPEGQAEARQHCPRMRAEVPHMSAVCNLRALSCCCFARCHRARIMTSQNISGC